MDYAEIIAYLNGDVSTTEKAGIESWRSANSVNEREFQQVKRVWEAKLMQVPDSDTEEVWSKLKRRMDVGSTKGGKTPTSWLWRLTATAAMALLTIGVWSLVKEKSSDWIEVRNTQVENALVHELKDGTMIELAPDSYIRYPAEFDTDTREVELSGQGRFFVEQNAEKPFTVKTSNNTVQVLGTTFDLMAHPDSQRAWVQLHEGKVRFSSNQETDLSVELSAGQSAIFDSRKQSFSQMDSIWVSYINARDSVYVIREASVKEVADLLEKEYKVKIKIEPSSFEKYKMDGEFPKSTTISEFMDIIRFLFDIEITAEGNVYTWKCINCPD
ncbi:MAG: FecR domain-containing protein [Saprospiraceae bacterium]|nr:FecR domain-containing protein [Saprospiraceae bacterium]